MLHDDMASGHVQYGCMQAVHVKVTSCECRAGWSSSGPFCQLASASGDPQQIQECHANAHASLPAQACHVMNNLSAQVSKFPKEFNLEGQLMFKVMES